MPTAAQRAEADRHRRHVAAAHPAWDVWTVPTLVNGLLWCARRRANVRWVLHADSSEHLVEYIAEAEAEAGE